MKQLLVFVVVFSAILAVASNAWAADQLRSKLQTQDRIFQQDQTCQQDCLCDYPNCDGVCDCPNCDGDCPQIQQQDRDRLNRDIPVDPDWGWFLWQYGWGQ